MESFPLDVATPMKGERTIAAHLQTPAVRVEPVIASVHVINSRAFYGKAFDEWRSGTAADRMAGLAESAGSGAAIVARDFNNTHV